MMKSGIRPNELLESTAAPSVLGLVQRKLADGTSKGDASSPSGPLPGIAPGVGDDRRYTLALLDLLLGGGMSSRLFQNIREKYGFAYSVFSFSDIMAETGVFGSYIACDKNKVDESIQLLQNEIDKIKNGDITNDEVDMVKSQVRGNLIIGLESNGRRMKKIGETESYGGKHRSLEEILGMPKYIISFFAVAIGTSLPELAVDFEAIREKKYGLAIGDILASNITDATIGMGAGPLIAPNIVTAVLAVSSGWYMILASIAAVLLFAWRRKIDRKLGIVFIAIYLLSYLFI